MEWEVLERRNVSWDALCAEEKQFSDRARRDNSTTLLLSEPRAVFTYGTSAKKTDLLWTDSECEARGVTLAKAERGGQWTYHGPGQILLYPIARLETMQLGSRALRCYVERLRDTAAAALLDLGVSTTRGETPFGLYVDDRKIASFGVSAHRGIVAHGVAIYLTLQENFAGIAPCGVRDGRTVSVEELGATVSWHAAASRLVARAKEILCPERVCYPPER